MIDALIEQLVNACKGEVSIVFNEHRNAYLTVAEYLADEGVSAAEAAPMIAADRICSVQAYPHTPIGFVRVHAATLEAALTRACEAIR